jgi:hypothetical protein
MNLREGTRMVDAEGPEPSRSEPCPQTHIPTRSTVRRVGIPGVTGRSHPKVRETVRLP